MNGVKYVTATFQPKYWNLSIRPIASGGNGTVGGTGITCATSSPDACVTLVPNTKPATVVTLTAGPDELSVVSSWSGCTSWSGNTCTVSMTGAKYVSATFQPSTWTLNARTSGLGNGTVTGAGIDWTAGATGTCSVPVPKTTPATVVTLTAQPDAESILTGWSGGSSVSRATCNVAMNGVKYVTATFQPRAWTLSVRIYGTGAGTVTAGRLPLPLRLRGRLHRGHP